MIPADLSGNLAAAAQSGGPDGRLPSQLSPEEFRILAAAGVSRAVLPGEELFRRGEAAQSMFLIDTGEIRLGFDDGLADKLLGPGQYFGELAVFIGRHQRFARAVAETPGVLYEITQSAFQSLVDREPAHVARFMQRSFAYLVAGEHQLVQHLKRRNEDLMQTLDTLRQTRTELTVAQQLVRTDDLTGLANRRGLYRFLDELGRQDLTDLKLALLLVDIDHFKQINDQHGHATGDAALQAIGEALAVFVAEWGLFAARFGGEEFLVCMEELPLADGVARMGELLARIGALEVATEEGVVLHCTFSAGVAELAPGQSAHALLAQADDRLLQAKQQGRNRIVAG